MDVHLAFIGYILPSSVLPVIELTSLHQFVFQVVMPVMPTFTVQLVFVQSIPTVL